MNSTAFNLKASELCCIIRISKRTLFNWLKLPHPPPHVKIGHCLRFSEELFRGWLEQYRRG